MLEEFAYHAAIMAPEIAVGAAEFAGEAASGLLKTTGRHLAAGMADEISARAPQIRNGLISVAGSMLDKQVGKISEQATDAVATKLETALRAGRVSLVSTEELAALREIAAAVSTGEDHQIPLEKLRTFHRPSAGNMLL